MEDTKTIKKPPIGLIPKNVYISIITNKRFEDVCGAISRYYNEGMEIPIEWVEEYNELIVKLRGEINEVQ